MTPLRAFAAVTLTLVQVPAGAIAQSPTRSALAVAADRMAILELSARFDNALDAENAEKFAATFTPDGALVGFWGQSKGAEELRKAHAFMLATFAKNKRHVVTNHEITVDGDHARMFCYLTVFDRNALAVTGTATFTDELVRRGGTWKFIRRELRADPNVDGIINALKKG